METDSSSKGYRVELMHLRRRVEETRRSYRNLAIFLAILALVVLSNAEQAAEPLLTGLLVAAIGLLSLASALAYRNVPKQPRFWSLPARAANSLFVIGWGSMLIANLSGVWRGEVPFGELVGTYLLGFLFSLGLLLHVNSLVVSREDAALIEEHREEWDAYLAGRRRGKSSRARGARRVPETGSAADAGA